MPCPDFNVSIVKRSDNKSAVAAAAYQSGSRLFSEYDQKWKNYTGKHEVVHAEIMLPPNAPAAYSDRQTLWNAVEAMEKQWNAQLARKFRMALPREIPPEQYVELVRRYCQEQFVSKGMICDFAIHDKGDGNPHVHIQLTMRSMDAQGRWNPKAHKVYVLDENGERIRLSSGEWKSKKKDVVDWNDHKYCEIWRSAWADIQNEYLQKNNRTERVDLRSYERQGIDQVPTVHMGPAVAALENKGIETNIGNLNRDIREHNSLMSRIRKTIRQLTVWITDLSEKRKRILEALRERKEPTLTELLLDYMEVRSNERSGWSGVSKVKGAVSDYEKVSAALDFLKAHEVQTVDDLKALLDQVGGEVSSLRGSIRKNERRGKEIFNLLGAWQTYQRLSPVHAEYQKKGFRKTKEKYYFEHKDELDELQKAYRYLIKNGAVKEGSKLKLDTESLHAEQAQLLEKNAALQAQLDDLTGDLKMLRTVKYYVSKVQPEPEEIAEIVKTDPEGRKSVRAQLRERQERIAREEAAGKQTEKKKDWRQEL